MVRDILYGFVSRYSIVISDANVSAIINKNVTYVFVYHVLLKFILKYFFSFEYFFFHSDTTCHRILYGSQLNENEDHGC